MIYLKSRHLTLRLSKTGMDRQIRANKIRGKMPLELLVYNEYCRPKQDDVFGGLIRKTDVTIKFLLFSKCPCAPVQQ